MLQLALELLRMPDVVVVEKRDVVAGYEASPGIKCTGSATVGLVCH